MSAYARVTGIALLAALAACASPKATSSGFLSDYSALTPREDGSDLVRSAAADAKRIASFGAVRIAPVEVLAGGLSPDQSAAVAASLQNALMDEFAMYWRLTDMDGPDVMTVRAAVTDIHKSNVALNVVTTALLAPVDFGTLSVEGEVKASDTGEQLAALAWARRSGLKQTFQTFTPTGSGRALSPAFARELTALLGKNKADTETPPAEAAE